MLHMNENYESIRNIWSF